MNLPKQLTTQTRESKYLSYLLFIALPIIAGFIVYVNMKEIWDHKLLHSIRRNTDLRVAPLQNNAGFSINELGPKDLLQSETTPEFTVNAYGKEAETNHNNTSTGYYSVLLKLSNTDNFLISDRPYFGVTDHIFDIVDNKIYVTNSSRNSIDIYDNEGKFSEAISLQDKIDGKLYGIECVNDECVLHTGIEFNAGCTYSWKIGTKVVEQVDCFYAL